MSAPRLAVIISTLAMGGAERVVSMLAQAWVSQGIKVSVITLSGPENDFYTLPPEAERISLRLQGPSSSPARAVLTNLKRLAALRRVLLKLRPHAVVSHLDATNVLAVLAATGLGMPVVVTEHTDLLEYSEYLPRPWRMLRGPVYRRAAAVVAVNRHVAGQLAGLVPPEMVQAVPNPVEPGGCLGEPELALGGPLVASMGRLVRSKGFDLLLPAFADCLERHPGWRLMILGDGPERQPLEQLARGLGVEQAVVFAGAVKEPGAMLAQAELFALATRFEAFPMSLVEAMACGLPVVCTRYPADPGEIVRQGVDGLIVEVDDRAGLSQALCALMADSELRREMGGRAQEVSERFAVGTVVSQWNRLLTRVTGRDWPGV